MEPIRRAGRPAALVALCASWLLAGCPRGGVGEPCNDQRDCQRGLTCNPFTGVCEGGDTDAAATDAGGGTDAIAVTDSGGATDAGTDSAATDAGTDSATTDAGGTDSGPSQWTPTPVTGAPQSRAYHSAVWTGTEMIIWGGAGMGPGGEPVPLDTGARYDPVTDIWTPMPTLSAPSVRYAHATVWTGTEMIVWGGADYDALTGANLPVDTGGRYDPMTDMWTATETVGAPSARFLIDAVWTGTDMIVWGGAMDDGSGAPMALPGGGRYDPVMNAWTPTNPASEPAARFWGATVWTGSEMLVWGGAGSGFPLSLADGGHYDAMGDSWSPTGSSGVPSARLGAPGVWTSTEMIVWGGSDGLSTPVATGGRYDPVSTTWTATSSTGTPPARFFHAAVWTSTDMIVWGGATMSPMGDITPLAGGGHYDPVGDSWMLVPSAGEPAPRWVPTAVWTGTELIVWGGFGTDALGTPDTLDTGGRYLP